MGGCAKIRMTINQELNGHHKTDPEVIKLISVGNNRPPHKANEKKAK